MTAAAMPSPRFWDKIAPRYARQPIADEAAYAEKLRRTQARLTTDMEVLELGCGTGGTAIVHAPFVKSVMATDLSPEMLKIAEGKARVAGAENVAFAQLAVETMTPTKTYDVVLALSLLHLLDDRQSALDAIWSSLKPGGIFVSSTACLGDMNPIYRIILPVGRALGLFPSVGIFSGETLRSELRAKGFEIEDDWRPAPGKALFLIARKPG